METDRVAIVTTTLYGITRQNIDTKTKKYQKTALDKLWRLLDFLLISSIAGSFFHCGKQPAMPAPMFASIKMNLIQPMRNR
jgi:hypothetical protein